MAVSHAEPPSFADAMGRAGLPLSEQPETREVELAFIRKLDASYVQEAKLVLEGSGLREDDLDAPLQLRLMRHPVFVKIARALERAMPGTAGLDRFDPER